MNDIPNKILRMCKAIDTYLHLLSPEKTEEFDPELFLERLCVALKEFYEASVDCNKSINAMPVGVLRSAMTALNQSMFALIGVLRMCHCVKDDTQMSRQMKELNLVSKAEQTVLACMMTVGQAMEEYGREQVIMSGPSDN